MQPPRKLALCRFSGLIVVSDRQKLRIACCMLPRLPNLTSAGSRDRIHCIVCDPPVPSIPLRWAIPSSAFAPIAIGPIRCLSISSIPHITCATSCSRNWPAVPTSGRNLRADVVQGEVVLTGAVATYYQKQMAQESVRTIEGVTSVRNELEVMSH